MNDGKESSGSGNSLTEPCRCYSSAQAPRCNSDSMADTWPSFQQEEEIQLKTKILLLTTTAVIGE